MREGWNIKRFDEVFDLQMGKTPDRKNYALFEGNNTWVSIRDMNDKYICSSNECISDDAAANIKMVKKGTVIMSFKLSVGKCAIAAKDLYTNEAIMAFNLKKGYQIDSSFLYYYLQNYKWIGGNKAVKGITLNKATISRHKIQIPPMPYQKDIVAELDQINDLIRLKKDQLKEYDNLAQSIFYDMFGDPVENEKGWEVKKLGDLCEITSSKRIFAKEYVADGVPFYRSKEVAELGANKPIEIELFIDSDKYQAIKEKYGVPNKGDILIAAIGATIGKMWVVNHNKDFYFKDGNIIWLKNTGFVAVYIKTILNYLINGIKESLTNGGAYPALTIVTLKALEIVYPPLPLQQEFSSRIEQIEKLKTEVQKTITDLETLLASRMQYWFE